ncbi:MULTISPECIES: hypothetical protein [unclassified Streptomyces]|uniref:hypothetical protein n=1 Tax=unclassified Streptomyces TaxID=2593676 RepID=UPI0013A69279|nr:MULTISPECIES: hypothetical protein [unclassified Streptomyces]
MNRTTRRVPGVASGGGPFAVGGAARSVSPYVLACLGAAVLLTGCGEVTGNEPVGPGVSVRTESAAPCPESDSAVRQAPPTLIHGTPANTPEATRLSQAIGAQARGAFADVYSVQITDHPAGRVALCVTDPARGRLLLEAAHAADPGADPARADVYVSPYSHRTLNAAAARIIALKADFPVYSTSGGHGSSVEVTTNQEGSWSAEFKARLQELTGGIPVTLKNGEPVEPLLGDQPLRPAP